MTKHNYFSKQSVSYKNARPHYPEALFRDLASLVDTHDHVWDVGCGNGQASVHLAEYFNSVTATDLSPEQLAYAPERPNITYVATPAEHAPMLGDSSVDMVTVATAAHWFDHPQFYREVVRVLRPGGVLSMWSYYAHSISPGVDEITKAFSSGPLGPFWVRAGIDHNASRYKSLPEPGEALGAISMPKTYEMTKEFSLEGYLEYLRSWSASQRWSNAHEGRAATELVEEELAQVWPQGQTLTARWELFGKFYRQAR